MCEELITDIRYCVSGDKPCGECKHIEEWCCATTLMKQAADAIEQLDKDLERAKEWASFWEEEANEALKKFQVAVASKPRWIPVTERLPEQGKRYLVIRLDEITKTQFIDILWHDAHDLWWNRLYKGQYNVTHWMPLPTPPKEETK